MTSIANVGLIFILISFHVTKGTLRHRHGYFSWENVFGPPQKPLLWTQKPEGTSSAMFKVGTAAKCCEFKQCVLTSTRFDLTRVKGVTVRLRELLMR